MIEVAEIVLHEADEPDLVLDLSNAHGLAGEHGREVYLASSDADAPAAGHAH